MGSVVGEMEKSQWYIGTPNEVVLCIDQVEEYRFTGRLYHAYSAAATVFLSMDEAVFQMEQLYDSLNFPYQGTIIRSFGKKQFWEQAVRQERKRAMSEEELLSRHGELGTFIICVQHRQNSSWQGHITWTDKDATVYFRSVWEMVKLVSGAIDAVSVREAAGEVSWDNAVD